MGDAAVPFMQWKLLPRAYHCRVDDRARAEAAARLESRSSIAIAAKDVSAYCAGFEPPKDASLRPYLVRGVAHARPTYSSVRRDEATGRMAVRQATWDGENVLDVWRIREAQSRPVVVYVPREPLEVYPVALMGGDRILSSPEFAEEMEYARSLCWDAEDYLLGVATESGANNSTSRCTAPRK